MQFNKRKLFDQAVKNILEANSYDFFEETFENIYENFKDLCSTFSLSTIHDKEILNQLSKILFAKQLQLPFLCIHDPLEVASIFIQNIEADNELEIDGMAVSDFNDQELDGGYTTKQKFINCIISG